MNKYMNKIVRRTLAAAGALLLCCSCSDTWDEHYDTNSDVLGTSSIMESLQSSSNLSDFVQVLKATGYDDVLGSEQIFTVWAPVNGTFNKDSLLSLVSAGKTSDVIKRFVNNHISRYNYSNSSEAVDVTMLNTKTAVMENGLIGDANITSANNHCSNGVLHIIDNKLPFKNNIYEEIEQNSRFSLLYDFLNTYAIDSLDESRSVARGLDEDGNTVYVDSVMIETNTILESLDALISEEDSNYWAILPTDVAYKERYDAIYPLFAFNPSMVDNVDSLQSMYANRYVIYDSFFNMNRNKHIQDSLVATTYSTRNPEHNVFYHPYETINDSVGIMENCTEEIECSNGTVYPVDELPMSIYDVVYRPIKIEAEFQSNVNSDESYTKLCSYTSYTNSSDSISNGYLDIVPTSSSANPTIGFNISGNLSGTYEIYLVMVPKNVMNSETTDYRPYQFRAQIYEMNDNGAFPTAGTYLTTESGDRTFNNDPTVVDSVYLGTYNFSHCYQGQSVDGVILRITSYITSRQTSSYSREMLVDCIYLKPKYDE